MGLISLVARANKDFGYWLLGVLLYILVRLKEGRLPVIINTTTDVHVPQPVQTTPQSVPQSYFLLTRRNITENKKTENEFTVWPKAYKQKLILAGEFWIEALEFCLKENWICVVCSALFFMHRGKTTTFSTGWYLLWPDMGRKRGLRSYYIYTSTLPFVHSFLLINSPLQSQFTFHFNRFWHNSGVTFTMIREAAFALLRECWCVCIATVDPSVWTMIKETVQYGTTVSECMIHLQQWFPWIPMFLETFAHAKKKEGLLNIAISNAFAGLEILHLNVLHKRNWLQIKLWLSVMARIFYLFFTLSKSSKFDFWIKCLICSKITPKNPI